MTISYISTCLPLLPLLSLLAPVATYPTLQKEHNGHNSRHSLINLADFFHEKPSCNLGYDQMTISYIPICQLLLLLFIISQFKWRLFMTNLARLIKECLSYDHFCSFWSVGLVVLGASWHSSWSIKWKPGIWKIVIWSYPILYKGLQLTVGW